MIRGLVRLDDSVKHICFVAGTMHYISDLSKHITELHCEHGVKLFVLLIWYQRKKRERDAHL